MSKNISNYMRLIVFILFFSIPAFSLPSSKKSIIKDNPKEIIDEVWQTIYRDYLDSSGDYDQDKWIELRRQLLATKYVYSEDAYVVIREMLESLNDPYTRFLEPDEFLEMRRDTSGELMGVGIQISLDKDTNKLVVISPIEGTPAFNAGIQAKDIIVSINGELTEGMGIDKAVELIRGEKGTSVNLGILRGDDFINLSLIRDRIEINSVHSRLNLTNNGLKIGYIRLKQFNANAAREMSESIKELEADNVLGYVLDLRSNPGGLLEASVAVARQWIDQGIIVSTRTKDGINDVRVANGNSLTSKPVVVLVNEGSASASEILAGAIRDNERGILVGQKTFGKGLVQSVRALSDGSGLTVTIAKYLTPKGTDINRYGIEPDIKARLTVKPLARIDLMNLGTSNDNQYKVAETALLKKLAKQMEKSSYLPGNANLKSALAY